MMKNNRQNQRLTYAQKEANKKAWYKEQALKIRNQHHGLKVDRNGASEVRKMKVNYDLFNNIVDLSELYYVCHPLGDNAGELPAKMMNRDISSGKIKAILGMEAKRPFSWKVVATNPEATTRKEEEEFSRIKEYVVGEIMKPIQAEIQQKAMESTKGRELSEEEVQAIQAQVEQQIKTNTPEETKKYMAREHQDPVEVMSHQLLEYLIQKCDTKRKFGAALKHGLLSAKSVIYVGVLNGEPELWNVNSIRFNCEKSADSPFIEDSESASCEYMMTPSEIVKYFGDELKPDEIDRIYDEVNSGSLGVERDLFYINDNVEQDSDALMVTHTVWKSLRKIGFLTYEDEEGQEQMTFVDESYKVNKEAGDIKIDWEWLVESYQTWTILEDIFLKMGPIPGQFKDPNKMSECKLPYYGVVYDDMNSTPTSLMDRLKTYQYYYNIIMYRIELLIASDKGKKVLMNINAIPDTDGFDMETWKYFFESSPFMWYDPNAEGSGYNDVNTVAKTVDLSLVSDIGKYIDLARFLKEQAGTSVGITEQVEGQIGSGEAVRNTQQSLVQTSHILSPYFELHSYLKRNVLTALLETAKVAYSGKDKKVLSYVLDDLSVETFNLDVGLFDSSTLGLFISNSVKAEEAMQLIQQLAQSALQTQKAEFSDVISVIRQESITEAEEVLKVAEQNRREQDQAIEERRNQAMAEEGKKVRDFTVEQHKMELEKIALKADKDMEKELLKSSLMAASFNPDQDKDGDGINDFIEIARDGINADIKQRKQDLDEAKFEHQKKVDIEKLKNEKKKQNSKK